MPSVTPRDSGPEAEQLDPPFHLLPPRTPHVVASVLSTQASPRLQVELPRQLDRCDHVRMKILGEGSTWLPFREKLAIAEDLRLVGATEQAGYLVRYPIGSEKVQWLRAAIYIATKSGLFAFQRTSGWDEPGRTADGTALEPWSTHGAFTPWHEVSGAELRLRACE
jgi:hypothetical protein